jgi:hypothetical protein
MARRKGFRPVVERTAEGLVINLDQEEIDLVVRLLGELRGLLMDADPTHAPLLRRLFPPAYIQNDDAEAETEYQRLMHDDLVASRLEAVTVVEGLLSRREPLDEAAGLALLQSLNGVRLVLGTLIDIGENDDPNNIDDDDPLVGELHLYHFLSFLLEHTVQAVSGWET